LRLAQYGGTLSGGEQQMLAIARALMSRPRLLLLDEPSLGLAPLVMQLVFEIIASINRERQTAILLVEQNAFKALKLADRAYVMVNGRIAREGAGADLLSDPGVRTAYLGGSRAAAP
jgi:branched-chain amino acid transport system ATP-binding protein